MDIDWHVRADDKACVKALVKKQGKTKIVHDRYDRNLAESKPQITKDRLWRAMVCMRLTTLARAGPTGKLGCVLLTNAIGLFAWSSEKPRPQWQTTLRKNLTALGRSSPAMFCKLSV